MTIRRTLRRCLACGTVYDNRAQCCHRSTEPFSIEPEGGGFFRTAVEARCSAEHAAKYYGVPRVVLFQPDAVAGSQYRTKCWHHWSIDIPLPEGLLPGSFVVETDGSVSGRTER